MTIRLALSAVLALGLTSVAACGSDNKSNPDAPVIAPPPDAAPDAPMAPDCVMNPTTSADIMNACTDAIKIDKKPTLPLLKADGTLPDLPQ
jgi:hypothetical protein